MTLGYEYEVCKLTQKAQESLNLVTLSALCSRAAAWLYIARIRPKPVQLNLSPSPASRVEIVLNGGRLQNLGDFQISGCKLSSYNKLCWMANGHPSFGRL